MNWNKIKEYQCYEHFVRWADAHSNDGAHMLFRELYDYFDSLQIIVMPINNHKKGTNVWSVKIIIDKLNINNKMGVYKSRSIAETIGFEMAFELLEDNFNSLVRTCANTLPH